VKNAEFLSYPYSGKYSTITQWELCYCYSENNQAGLIVWDKETKLYIFQLYPMFGRHILGLSKLYYKVRFRNLDNLKTFIASLGVDELKSCVN
jgi:hypothetical protein